MPQNRLLTIALVTAILIGLVLTWPRFVSERPMEPRFTNWLPYRDPGIVLRVDYGARGVECGAGADRSFVREIEGRSCRRLTGSHRRRRASPDEGFHETEYSTLDHEIDYAEGYRTAEQLAFAVEFDAAPPARYLVHEPIQVRTPQPQDAPQPLVVLEDLGLTVSWMSTAIALKLVVSRIDAPDHPPIAGGSARFLDKRADLAATEQGHVTHIPLANLRGFLGRALNVQVDVRVTESGSRVDIALKLPE